jgi:hypothetical protein
MVIPCGVIAFASHGMNTGLVLRLTALPYDQVRVVYYTLFVSSVWILL